MTTATRRTLPASPLMVAFLPELLQAPCTANTPDRTRVGSVGIPLPGTTIRVAEDGEVLVKGIGVFKAYHGNQAASAGAFVDGFFRTGDLGGLDAEGFLTITGPKEQPAKLKG
jgi:long-chain acyl-CoA synthetase